MVTLNWRREKYCEKSNAIKKIIFTNILLIINIANLYRFSFKLIASINIYFLITTG